MSHHSVDQGLTQPREVGRLSRLLHHIPFHVPSRKPDVGQTNHHHLFTDEKKRCGVCQKKKKENRKEKKCAAMKRLKHKALT